ncbi:MAG: VWA domain-containing protein [Chloracidobacterium sp.]|nr:VWA domain-containing protein [Chloracidobacterium sp.]
MNRHTYPLSLWTRAALSALALLVATLTVVGQSQEEKSQQDPQTSIKIPTGLVTVPVIVTDRYGRFVTGLNRNQFAVREGGSLQKIEEFSSTEAPFSVALLIDTSHSTHNKLPKIRKAARTFIKQLLPNDKIMVVSFDDKVRFVCDFSSDHTELEHAVNSLDSHYATSLYDAIYLTINEKMNKIQGRKAIVILTDGVDTASKQATFQSAVELAASAGIITYTVQYETRNDSGPVMKPRDLPGIGNYFAARSGSGLRWQDFQSQAQKPESEESGSHSFQGAAPIPTPGSLPSSRVNGQIQQPKRDPYLIAGEFLRTLAAQSGGLPFRAETIENTSYAFQLISNELHNQYTLTYISTNEQRDGAYRAIAVGVNNPDLVVRSRRFYRSPKE